MDHRRLLAFIATVLGTIGDRMALQVGLRWIMEGVPGAPGAFIGRLHAADTARLVPVLIEADAPPELLRQAIRAVVLYSHESLPALVRAAGGRRQFADWCRRAQFELPSYLPAGEVTIARGTINCTPEQNAAGMHWSIGCPGSDPFDGAAFFASGWPHPTVVVAQVPRASLVYFVDGVIPYEVLPEDVPAVYEIITDTARIVEGAVRFAYHRRDEKSSHVPFDPILSKFDRSAAELIAFWEASHRVHDGAWEAAQP